MSTQPSQPPTHRPAGGVRPERTPGQTALLTLGTLLLVSGAVCLVLGFSSFADSVDDPEAGSGGALALFAGGGLAMVAGLAVVALTRVAVLQRAGSVRSCAACGAPARPGARFCASCGTALA